MFITSYRKLCLQGDDQMIRFVQIFDLKKPVTKVCSKQIKLANYTKRASLIQGKIHIQQNSKFTKFYGVVWFKVSDLYPF